MKITELQRVRPSKVGRIIMNNVKLEPHEDSTALFLAQFGFDIEYIRPTNIHKNHNADFFISGAVWETKSPDGGGKSTISRKFHNASKQSDRMILDLRRIQLPTKEATDEALKRFQDSRRIRHLLLITKDEKLLDVRK